MTQLETLASVQGRKLLRDIYQELRFERRLNTLQTLGTLWRICTSEQELIRRSKRDVVVLHPLGPWQGTTLWMQEVVNRYYFSAINAWVYAGAALLLVAVGLTRLGVVQSTGMVVTGIVVEAVLLLVLFAVMYFTPPDDADETPQTATSDSTTELLREIGEIGRDYAAMAVQLEAIAASLNDLVERQDAIVNSMHTSVQAAVQAVAPNPEMLGSMKATTAALEGFATTVQKLTDRLKAVETHEVERHVRTELERILTRQILGGSRTDSAA